MDPKLYLEKVYGGLIGKCAGVRLGAPVEPTIWTYERIRETYGEITGYIKNYKNFAADDDINGPLFFIRTLIDHPGPVTPLNVGRAWLNYTREGIGFYWWGGYGRSTEHTAYLNLKDGIDAPESGSIEVNGETIAEQIGGQIFIDSWGWVIPDNPGEAARHAAMAASVGHDRNGIYGAKFIAACISLAFSDMDISRIIDRALTEIPPESEYARVVKAVRDYHSSSPDDWRGARQFLEENFGYDRYGGVCHIIPNAGVCALALYYGNGDFSRTIEIATMCGWDTDCNAGNTGAILGVLAGPRGIPERYRRPINDWHAASSISGALNNINLPSASRELAVLGLRLKGESVPEEWLDGCFSDDIVLDFSLPGATAGIRTSSSYLAPISPGRDFYSDGGLVILLDRLVRGDTARIFYKPFYQREDFDDERYKPTFTPTVFPGQQLLIKGSVSRMSGHRIALAPYVADAKTKKIIQGEYIFPDDKDDFEFNWVLPGVPFAISETGLLATNFDSEKYLGKIVLDEFSVSGRREFDIQFADESEAFQGLSRCSAVGGYWAVEDGSLHVITRDEFLLFAGPYYTADSEISAELVPEYGESHLLSFRSRGAEYGYFFGLHGGNRVALLKKDGDVAVLSEQDFKWQPGGNYTLEVSAVTSEEGLIITCGINGTGLINHIDKTPHPYGMAGLGKIKPGRTRFVNLHVREL